MSAKAISRQSVLLALVVALGVGLRLLAWRWSELRGLGGDEQEYFDQAVTLLRDKQYIELRLMRPPLYPLFLAACVYVVDSLVQNLRLIQALVSAATIPLVYLLTLELAGWRALPGDNSSPLSRAPALLAALGCALSYSLAANATELLAETPFLFGLTVVLWLLLRAARTRAGWLAGLAGLALGALCLLRSVALPLLPLGALWLFLQTQPVRRNTPRESRTSQGAVGMALLYTFCALLVVLPWTARNYQTYGGLILIDTTGAENLWLDNDPAGREAVKVQLYALGEDRLARQRLATERGSEAILAEPGRFVAKMGNELRKLFALEFSDDMQARQTIWVRPAEVWVRLLLGDALWLLLLLAGSYGLSRALLVDVGTPDAVGQWRGWLARFSSPAWLLAPWAAYVLLTTLIFHVELRYRLPVFPVLLPYAALALLGKQEAGSRKQEAGSRKQEAGSRRRPRVAGLPAIACCLLPIAFTALTLLHANYPVLAWQLGWKHWHLGQAERALARGDLAETRREAILAQARDPRSALAALALARADVRAGSLQSALTQVELAVAALPDHPQARVLRGDLWRAQGNLEAARTDLAYETASQQDLQAWGWANFATAPPARLDFGDGLDLGFLRGFHSLRFNEQGYRWTTQAAQLRVAVSAGTEELVLRVASGRPPASAPVTVEVWATGLHLGRLSVGPDWQEQRLALNGTLPASGVLEIELRSPIFRARQFDPASPDGRALGVQVDWVTVR